MSEISMYDIEFQPDSLSSHGFNVFIRSKKVGTVCVDWGKKPKTIDLLRHAPEWAQKEYTHHKVLSWFNYYPKGKKESVPFLADGSAYSFQSQIYDIEVAKTAPAEEGRWDTC